VPTNNQASFVSKPFSVGNQPRNVVTSSVVKQSPVILHGSNPMAHPQVPQSQPSSGNAKNGLYAAAAAAANNPILLAQMQNWKLDQLEAHVNLLRDANQQVPQPISLLLAEARRREEKRTAKRVANRKSACTSRARKKALVEEMTRTNAKLRRQAMILALLPDLVIAIKVDGEITFCSAQVERVLRHKVDDMVGANILQLLLPSCREALFKLVEKLLAAANEQSALDDSHKHNQVIVDEGGGSANFGGNGSGGAAIVSDPSEQGFPTVVKVQSRTHSPGTREDVSDSTGNTDMKSPNRSPRSPDQLNSGLTRLMSSSSSKGQSSNKDSSSSGGDESSTSAVAKQLHKANEALDSNVRRHNAQLMSTKGDFRVNKLAHKDDVTGASVTANNAGARLSSLQVNPTLDTLNDTSSSTSTDSLFAGMEDKRIKARVNGRTSGTGEVASDDSGYRESGESDPSREDSASSTSDTSNGSRSRPRPLAPTCNVTLIRDDLTTILCEVTSSIRTRSLSDENCDSTLLSGSGGQVCPGEKGPNAVAGSDNTVQGGAGISDQKELLLCLRPIRDGDETIGEDFRFVKSKCAGMDRKKNQERNDMSPTKLITHDKDIAMMRTTKMTVRNAGVVKDGTEHSGTELTLSDIKAKLNKMKQNKSRPMKKRPLSSTPATKAGVPGNTTNVEHSNKKMRTSTSKGGGLRVIDTEKSVAESLMLMSSHK